MWTAGTYHPTNIYIDFSDWTVLLQNFLSNSQINNIKPSLFVFCPIPAQPARVRRNNATAQQVSAVADGHQEANRRPDRARVSGPYAGRPQGLRVLGLDAARWTPRDEDRLTPTAAVELSAQQAEDR